MYVTALWQLQSSKQTENNTVIVLLYGAQELVYLFTIFMWKAKRKRTAQNLEESKYEVHSVDVTYPGEMVWIESCVASLSSAAKLHASVATVTLAPFY